MAKLSRRDVIEGAVGSPWAPYKTNRILLLIEGTFRAPALCASRWYGSEAFEERFETVAFRLRHFERRQNAPKSAP